MSDKFFRTNDKIRDFYRSSILYSSLTLFFSIYKIPITSIPFLSLNLDQKISSEIFKNVNITSILLIISIFYMVQACIMYFTEKIDWLRSVELRINKRAAENGFSARPVALSLNEESQQAYNSSQRELRKLYTCNTILNWFRVAFETLLPAGLLVIAIMREGENLWAFLRASVR